MALGAKLFSLIDASKKITLLNFVNSGYSFVGGIIGSALFVYLYCKRYKLKYLEMQLSYIITYPLLYSISKIGCGINGCCAGNFFGISVQWIETIIMFCITIYLWSGRKDIYMTISKFLILFGLSRFIVDYIRELRNVLFLNITLSQIVCLIGIGIGIAVMRMKKQ